MKRFVLALAVAAYAVGVFGSTAMAGEKKTYGLSFPTLANAWFTFLDDSVKAKAKDLGVEVISLDSNNEVSRQISVVEDMISRGVAGLLLVPTETEAIVPAVEKLNEAKIPVVTVDRRLAHGTGIVAHIGADNVTGGKHAAEFIVEKLTKKYGSPKGTVIELYGFVGSGPAIDRSAGFMEVMKKYPEITVKTQAANFMRADGMKVMEDFIVSTPKIDAVFGANDEMILGALEAMDASGRADLKEAVTVGFDALIDALKSISDGKLTATIEQFPGRQASTGFEILYDYVTKGKAPAKPVVLIEPIVITKDNLDAAEKSF